MYLFLSSVQSSYHYSYFFFFNDTATTEIYTLSLHDALPISQTLLRSLPAQPAAQEPAHERVPGAHGVEHLHGEARHPDAVFEVFWDLAGEDRGPHGAHLEHDGRGRQLSYAQERLAGLRRAAGDPDLFFCTHDEVAVGGHGAVDLRHLFAGDEHLPALLVGGNTPEDGPVVQVEEHLRPAGARALYGLHRGRRRRGARTRVV